MTDPLLRLSRALRELDAALQAAHVGPLLKIVVPKGGRQAIGGLSCFPGAPTLRSEKTVIAGVEVWDE